MIVDTLIAEIAAERGEDPTELKKKMVRKIEEERASGSGRLPANNKARNHHEGDH